LSFASKLQASRVLLFAASPGSLCAASTRAQRSVACSEAHTTARACRGGRRRALTIAMSSSGEGNQSQGSGGESRGSSDAERAVKAQPGTVRGLQAAIKANRRERTATYVQIATVEKGYPRVRTVVYRGLFEGSHSASGSEPAPQHAFLFCTDARSTKVAALEQDSTRAEIAWYLPVTREQYRLSGHITLVGASGVLKLAACESSSPASCAGADEARLSRERAELWQRLSPGAKAQFFWAGRPGEPLSSGWPGEYSVKVRDGKADAPSAPPEFLLGLLWIERIDWLSLKRNERAIDGRPVNP